MSIQKVMFLVLGSVAAFSGPAHADSILDKAKPHIGKKILLSAGSETTQVALTAVPDDGVCVRPIGGFEICYAKSTVVRVVVREDSDVHPVAITLDLPPGERLVGEAL